MRDGWEIKKLGDCFESIRNGANIKQERGASGIPITRIETLSGGVFNRDRLGYADILSSENYASYVLDDGDLLLSHINSKAYIGRTVVYNKLENEEIIHGMNLLRLKVIRKILSPYYAYYCFKSDLFRNQIASYRKDAVNQSSIPVTDLKKINIPIPPISEQEHIVQELDLLSGVIEKKRQQLKELDNLAQSIFYDMFGDPITNEKGWEVKKLGDIGKVVTGNTPSTKDDSNFSSSDYCFVKPSDISKENVSYIDDTEYYISSKAYQNSRKLPKGSVLTTCIGIIGKVGILGKNATCNQQINAIVLNDSCVAQYVAYMLFLMRNLLAEIANAPIVPIINKKEFSTVVVPIPPLTLQQEFAKKIEAIEKQKELIKQSLAETETLFNSRMDYYFN